MIRCRWSVAARHQSCPIRHFQIKPCVHPPHLSGMANLTAAVASVRESNMPIKTAARTFGVPLSSLRNRLKGKVNPLDRGGRPPALPPHVEEAIVDVFTVSAERGTPLATTELPGISISIARQYGIKGFAPGKKWQVGFRRRFKGRMSALVPGALSHLRNESVNAAAASKWLKSVAHLVCKIFKVDSVDKVDPTRLWNIDESPVSALPDAHRSNRVFVPTGTKAKRVGATEREFFTFVLACNAAGEYAYPGFIHKATNVNSANAAYSQTFTDRTGKEVTFAATKKGNMDEFLFQSLLKTLAPQMKASPTRPVVLVLDNHGSHVTWGSLVVAKSVGIEILGLPPNTTSAFQPLDAGIFGVFKRQLGRLKAERLARHHGLPLCKMDVISLVLDAVDKACTPEVIKRGFRITGLYPVSEEELLAHILEKTAKDLRRRLRQQELGISSSEDDSESELDSHVDAVDLDGARGALREILAGQALNGLRDRIRVVTGADLEESAATAATEAAAAALGMLQDAAAPGVRVVAVAAAVVDLPFSPPAVRTTDASRSARGKDSASGGRLRRSGTDTAPMTVFNTWELRKNGVVVKVRSDDISPVLQRLATHTVAVIGPRRVNSSIRKGIRDAWSADYVDPRFAAEKEERRQLQEQKEQALKERELLTAAVIDDEVGIIEKPWYTSAECIAKGKAQKTAREKEAADKEAARVQRETARLVKGKLAAVAKEERVKKAAERATKKLSAEKLMEEKRAAKRERVRLKAELALKKSKVAKMKQAAVAVQVRKQKPVMVAGSKKRVAAAQATSGDDDYGRQYNKRVRM